jgi:hypothetical protein
LVTAPADLVSRVFHSPAKASTAQKTPLGEHQGLKFPVKIFQVAIKAKLDRLVLNVTTRKRLEGDVSRAAATLIVVSSIGVREIPGGRRGCL